MLDTLKLPEHHYLNNGHGLKSWLLTKDHKRIAIMYLISISVMFLLGGLIVFRLGSFIPTPGIDPVALERFFQQQSGTILGLFNMFSGGALSRLSLFALGIMPYISASIIIQMVAVVYPPWQEWRKEEIGRAHV